MVQLERIFRRLPDDVAAAGILSSVTSCDPLDIKVSANLLSRVARPNEEPLHIVDDDLKARLRAYLKDGVEVELSQDDCESRTPPPGDDQRRTRFAAALNAEIKRLREQNQDWKPAAGLRELAKALAAIDGRGSAQVVLEVSAMPGEWDEYVRLETSKLLLMAGVVLPATTAFALVDSILGRSEKWLQDSDKSLVLSILALWPFFDNPAAGISRLRDVLGKWQLDGGELRVLTAALCESRSEVAADLLYELASDPQNFEKCADDFLNAHAALDTPRARELLMGFVDPDISGVAAAIEPHTRRHDVLVARLAELARRSTETAALLSELCEGDLPDLSRHVFSEVMNLLGTPEAFAANLNLIDDTRPSPVPRGIWNQLESAFVERKPDDQFPNAFTQHACAS